MLRCDCVWCSFFSSIDEIEGVESLRWEDQQKIRKYIDGNGVVSDAGAATRAPAAYGIEVSQTSRAACKRCSQKIIKGEVGMTFHYQFFKLLKVFCFCFLIFLIVGYILCISFCPFYTSFRLSSKR